MTYIFLGFTFGLIGELVYLGQFQQGFSAAIGVLVCLMAFAFFGSIVEGKLGRLAQRIIQPVKGFLKTSKKTNLSSFVSGILNGLLPCGLVYVAVFTASPTSSVISSMEFMLVFGIGTLPATLAISVLGKVIKPRLSTFFYRFSSIFVFFLGLILIIRGLGLDIPYLSPTIDFFHPNPSEPVICR